jgi:hypothetical protein
MTVYGTVRFHWLGEDVTARLTSDGWRVDSPDRDVSRAAVATFRIAANPADFSPADGDPMAGAVMKAARLMDGTYDLADLPGPPPGTVY